VTCAKCGLLICSCRSGKTRITVGAGTEQEGQAMAEAYLRRRGWRGDLLQVKRRQTKTGILGYKAWELTFRVVRP